MNQQLTDGTKIVSDLVQKHFFQLLTVFLSVLLVLSIYYGVRFRAVVRELVITLWTVASFIIKLLIYVTYVLPLVGARLFQFLDLWPSIWPFGGIY